MDDAKNATYLMVVQRWRDISTKINSFTFKCINLYATKMHALKKLLVLVFTEAEEYSMSPHFTDIN